MPANPGYLELHPLVATQRWDEAAIGEIFRRLDEYRERVGLPALSAVHKRERHAGIRAGEWPRGRGLNHLQAALLAAAKSGDVGQEAFGKRQRGHRIPVRAHHQARFVTRGFVFQYPLVRVKRALGGPQGLCDFTLDGGDV